MATQTISELVNDAKCIICLNANQSSAVRTLLLYRILTKDPMAIPDVSSLVDDAKCLACVPSNVQLAIQTYLLQNIAESSSGDNCIKCIDGSLEPVDDPGCTCALAYNQVGAVWFWDDSTTSWIPLIAGQ